MEIAGDEGGGTIAAMDSTTKKILEIVTDIQEKMVTKEDLEGVRRDLQAQISQNTRAIADLADQLRGVLGYAKEIDALMARVATLEKQVAELKK